MEKSNKAFQFRIYPTAEQEELFAKTFGCCRFIYNQMLSDKIEAYKKTGKKHYVCFLHKKCLFPDGIHVHIWTKYNCYARIRAENRTAGQARIAY